MPREELPRAVAQSAPFDNVHFLIVDFETVNPARSPARPIEVAVVALDLTVAPKELGQFSSLMRPTGGCVVTTFDLNQTGISQRDVDAALSDIEVMEAFEAFAAPHDPFVLVAHNASFERAILRQYVSQCEALCSARLLDSVLLAKHVLPGLKSYSLDNLWLALGLPKVANRHRALPDARATARLLVELLARWGSYGQLPTLRQLTDVAQLRGLTHVAEQSSLF